MACQDEEKHEQVTRKVPQVPPSHVNMGGGVTWGTFLVRLHKEDKAIIALFMRNPTLRLRETNCQN